MASSFSFQIGLSSSSLLCSPSRDLGCSSLPTRTSVCSSQLKPSVASLPDNFPIKQCTHRSFPSLSLSSASADEWRSRPLISQSSTNMAFTCEVLSADVGISPSVTMDDVWNLDGHPLSPFPSSSSSSSSQSLSSSSLKEYPSPEACICRGPSGGVPVFVMLPLDIISFDNKVTRRRAINASLLALKSAGVKGVMVDVWWGIVEKDGPCIYNWDGYKELLDMVKHYGLKVQAAMSFHQCGSSISDSCFIPLPPWVVEEIDVNQDLVYTDRHKRRNYECLSLGCDMLPVLKGRSPIQIYTDYMRNFRDNFRDIIGNTIVEIQVGMGPAGELRYPSYSRGSGLWRFPGIGEFQFYDKYMLSSLKSAAQSVDMLRLVPGASSDPEENNNFPEQSEFFHKEGSWNSQQGDFFLEWYSGMLVAHGERILAAAEAVFRDYRVKLSGKLASIHWRYNTRSHAAELTAGYYNTNFRDGYLPIVQMFARHGVVLNLTGIEMRDIEQPPEAMCSPETLIRQVVLAARQVGVSIRGENALPRCDAAALKQVVRASRLTFDDDPQGTQYERMCAFTFLRMSQALFQNENWRNFVSFVRQMAQNQKFSSKWDDQQHPTEFFMKARPFIREITPRFVCSFSLSR